MKEKKKSRKEEVAEAVQSYRNYMNGLPMNYNWYFSGVTEEEVKQFLAEEKRTKNA